MKSSYLNLLLAAMLSGVVLAGCSKVSTPSMLIEKSPISLSIDGKTYSSKRTTYYRDESRYNFLSGEWYPYTIEFCNHGFSLTAEKKLRSSSGDEISLKLRLDKGGKLEVSHIYSMFGDGSRATIELGDNVFRSEEGWIRINNIDSGSLEAADGYVHMSGEFEFSAVEEHVYEGSSTLTVTGGSFENLRFKLCRQDFD